jgi:AcrR family transcriptional regulator
VASASATMAAGASRLGRPRNADCDRAILSATLELLADHGYSGLSIEGVAARAAVGKTTIYRRWPTKSGLVADAISHVSEPPDLRQAGSVREALVRVVRSTTKRMSASTGRILSGMIAEMHRNPELAGAVREGFLAHRRAAVSAILERGVTNGELRPDLDVELVTDLIAGCVLYRLLLSGGRVDGGFPERTVDALLDGIARRD